MIHIGFYNNSLYYYKIFLFTGKFKSNIIIALEENYQQFPEKIREDKIFLFTDNKLLSIEMLMALLVFV